MEHLIEREADLRAVHDVVARAAAGRGGTVVVLGPPGIGKSALLATVPGPALRARGGELEQEFAYGVVRQLFEGPVRRRDDASGPDPLRGPAHPLAAVLRGAGAEGPGGDGFALDHAVYWLTAHLAEHGPVVITVDDAHWADLASSRALLHLSRRITDLPVAVVLATRPAQGSRRAVLDRIAAEAAVVLEPEPLTPTGVRALVHRELRTADDPFCEAFHAASGGNPFLVTELVRSVVAAGLAPVDVNAGAVRSVGARSVARNVVLRLAGLSDAAVAVARALAVLDSAHHDHVLAGLSGVPLTPSPADPVGLRAALGELRDAHLVAADDPPRFVHALVRDAVHDDLGATGRSRLHAVAARALAAAGAAAETVAGHLLCTDPGADPWVVDRLVAAAAGPAAASPDVVAAHLERALREGVPDLDPAPLLLALGAARFQTVDGDAASPLAEARRLARTPQLRVEATRALASALIAELRFDPAWDVVETTIAELADRPALAHDLEIFSAQLLCSDLPADRLATLLRRTRSWRPDPAGRSAPDRSMLALQAWTAACDPATAAGGAAMARAALASGTLVHDDAWNVSVDLAVWSLTAAGCYDEALAHLDTAVASCRRRGQRLRAATLLPQRAELQRRRGRLDRALADARAAIDVVTPEQVYAPLAAAALVLAQVDAGDPAAAWRVLETYGFDVELPTVGMADVVRFARGRLRVADGDLAGGVDDLLAYGALNERMGRRNPALYPWRSTAVGPLLQLGRTAEAVTLADQEVALADATGLPEHRGRARVALALARGEPTTAGTLAAAVELVAGSPCELAAAGARLTLGRVLRQEGRRTAALEPLRTAADVATRIGAAAIATAAREELVACGARPRRTAATGVAALTPSESRVAALAARGLTNREIARSLFVTPKTIETHLAGAYRKLGIATKRELADALAD